MQLGLMTSKHFLAMRRKAKAEDGMITRMNIISKNQILKKKSNIHFNTGEEGTGTIIDFESKIVPAGPALPLIEARSSRATREPEKEVRAGGRRGKGGKAMGLGFGPFWARAWADSGLTVESQNQPDSAILRSSSRFRPDSTNTDPPLVIGIGDPLIRFESRF
ncbi:hypothetical protein CRG98_042165 [Punica granatum]|uniref:Uncharacterized protein n=1 Tax=Punica granatum TaxID=22663 RepID=A0A2I0I118_PUNGR|nr:hypothetical protein CRG98_042165 [Punica granatum]